MEGALRLVKKTIATLCQFVVTVALLYWLLHDPQKRADMWHALVHAKRGWFLLGIAVYAGVEVLGALRWQVLLRVQNIHLPFWRVFQLFMIGVFFNVFLPGAVGGDVVKIFYLLKETRQQKAAAFLTVLMDRLLGLLALIGITAVILGPHYREFLETPATKALLVTLVFIMANAVGAILVSIVIISFGWINHLPQRLPGRAKLIEISAAYALYGRAWKSSLAGFLLSAAAHGLYFTTFYFAARAFTESVTWLNMMTVMPVVAVITSLPISISGVGVREGLFEKLLGDLYGVGAEAAVLISLTGFLIIVIWSAVGGIVYLFYRPSEHVGLTQIQDTVDAVEEAITHPLPRT